MGSNPFIFDYKHCKYNHKHHNQLMVNPNKPVLQCLIVYMGYELNPLISFVTTRISPKKTNQRHYLSSLAMYKYPKSSQCNADVGLNTPTQVLT